MQEKQDICKIIHGLVPDLSFILADPEEMLFIWDRESQEPAKFKWWREDEIILAKHIGFDLEHLISPICHELHHRWQYDTFGILYVIGSFPYIKDYITEPSAHEVQYAVERLLGLKD